MSKPNTQPAPAAVPSPPAPAAQPQKQAASPAPAPMPKPEPIRAKGFASQITSRFPDVKVEWMKQRRLKVSMTPTRIREVGLFARDTLGFDHISTVSGVDWIAKNLLEVDYFVGSSTPGQEDFILAFSELVARDNPVVPTLIDVWKGAEYHERETHEMFGINFQGHPNQSHILLPEDWNDMPPLRKDYVSPGR
ncbi:MAG TPA: NADH-quinone oxidoreductase subunit C [Nitrososphaerales archaeon]|nr:NADH-quinone oxidoreductase subunit C [Nitrososphaerales archaeon]